MRFFLGTETELGNSSDLLEATDGSGCFSQENNFWVVPFSNAT